MEATEQLRRIEELIYDADGFESHEAAATRLSMAIADILQVPYPWTPGRERGSWASE